MCLLGMRGWLLRGASCFWGCSTARRRRSSFSCRSQPSTTRSSLVPAVSSEMPLIGPPAVQQDHGTLWFYGPSAVAPARSPIGAHRGVAAISKTCSCGWLTRADNQTGTECCRSLASLLGCGKQYDRKCAPRLVWLAYAPCIQHHAAPAPTTHHAPILHVCKVRGPALQAVKNVGGLHGGTAPGQTWL